MVISAIIIIVLTTIGAFAVFSESKHIYVGNKSEMVFYDYKLCPDLINDIPKDNQIVFNDKEEASRRGYNIREGCVWNLIFLLKEGLSLRKF